MEFKKIGHKAKSGAPSAKTILAGAVLAASLMMAKPAKADSVEFMAGDKSATVDLKASADVTNKLNVFIRARPSADYSGAVSSFGLADLNIKLAGGLDAVGEVQAFGGKVIPRAGAQFFGKTGDISLFTAATIGLDSQPYIESDTVVRFTPGFFRTVRLLTQFENLTDCDKGGNIFSAQRLRLGLELNGWGAGAALDLSETGHKADIVWNTGGFISKRF